MAVVIGDQGEAWPSPASLASLVVAESRVAEYPSVTRDLERFCAHGTIDAEARGDAATRYTDARDAFVSRFHARAELVVRACGRVRLIGGIGRSSRGFGVVSSSVGGGGRDLLMLARLETSMTGGVSAAKDSHGIVSAEEVVLVSDDSGRYAEAAFSAREKPTSPLESPSIFDLTSTETNITPITPKNSDDASTPVATTAADDADEEAGVEWTRYVQAGLKGVFLAEKERLRDLQANDATQGNDLASLLRLPGMRVLVSGSLPSCAGLGTSSSLVCAAALLASHALRFVSTDPVRPPFSRESRIADAWNRREIANIASHAEGMLTRTGDDEAEVEDPSPPASEAHAAVFLSETGRALFYADEPGNDAATTMPVDLPAGSLVVVAHCASGAGWEPAYSTSSVRAKQHRLREQAASLARLRELECTLAAHAIAKQLKVSVYARDYWYRRHRSRTDAAADATKPAATPPPEDEPAPGDYPCITLADVLAASGMSLVQMITYLQEGVPAPAPAPASAPQPEPAPADDDEKEPAAESEANEPTTPPERGDTDDASLALSLVEPNTINDGNSSPPWVTSPPGATPAPPPLHSHPYTLPELLGLFGRSSLKPLIAFAPHLETALGEDAYFARLQAAARRRRADRFGSGVGDARVRTRVTFGRSIPTPRALPGEEGAEYFAPLPVPANAFAASPKDAPFPWETVGGDNASSTFLTSLPRRTTLDSVVDDVVDLEPPSGPQPYRAQGDDGLYSDEQVIARAALRRHPLVVKELNRFWTALPHTADGELHRDEYMTFFARLCKRLNPDLTFKQSWEIVCADWTRDVQRTRDVAAGRPQDAIAAVSAQVTPSSAIKSASKGNRSPKKETPVSSTKAKGKKTSKLSPTKSSKKSKSTAPSAPPEVELTSIPYGTFVSSLFELVDLWCPESSAHAYSGLLAQVFAKMTVRVESRGDGATTAAAADAEPTFALRARALHVFTEALRAQQFAELCARANPRQDELSNASGLEASAIPTDARSQRQHRAALAAGTLDSLGELMCASHVSLARDFESSTRDVDALVNICVQKAGAMGEKEHRTVEPSSRAQR